MFLEADRVTANYMYRGLYNELVAHMSAMHSLFTVYSYLIIPTVLASFVDMGPRPHFRIVYLIPFFTIGFAILFRTHARAVYRLRTALSNLEDGTYADSRLRQQTTAQKEAIGFNMVALGACFGSNVLASFVIYLHRSDLTELDIRLLPLFLTTISLALYGMLPVKR